MPRQSRPMSPRQSMIQRRRYLGQIERIQAVLADPQWADQHEYQSNRLRRITAQLDALDLAYHA